MVQTSLFPCFLVTLPVLLLALAFVVSNTVTSQPSGWGYPCCNVAARSRERILGASVAPQDRRRHAALPGSTGTLLDHIAAQLDCARAAPATAARAQGRV